MKHLSLLLGMTVLLCIKVPAQLNKFTTGYQHPQEMTRWMQSVAADHKEQTALHLAGKTWSGLPVYILEIGAEAGQQQKTKPAVFVAANFEGSQLLGSEAAVWLIRDLLDHPERSSELTWYVLPVGNPEAAASFFSSPLRFNQRNLRPYNDDMDDQTDEDPAEDLNGDGYVTLMRVKDPAGTLIPDSADGRLLRKADAAKGQRGLYRILTEGLDNDGDGKFNEDGTGGTNNGISFPHLFKHHHPGSGEWPGQEEEVYGVMKFFTDHPEIGLVMVYGSTNFCLQPPKSGRKGQASLSSLKIPRRYAGMLNADPDQTYSMSEVKEMMKAIVPPGTPVDDAMVAGMLGLGPVVNPLPKDLAWYKQFSGDYRTFLKKQKQPLNRLDPAAAEDGSFELWAYYHQGLPVFSQDFWGVPVWNKTKQDSAKKPDPQKSFLAYTDSLQEGKGFVNWTPFQHPDLGLVEIGGVVPWADRLPPGDSITRLLSRQVPWVYELAGHLPRLTIDTLSIEHQGAGVYRLEVWVRNESKLPFPTAMGSRNGTPPPAVLTIGGKELEWMQGLQRTPLKDLDAQGVKKLSWLLRIRDKQDLTIQIKAMNAYGSVKTIQTGGTRS